jgi:aspartyl-tRNA(Asn)/glutamyl-tRNA(Gln) amidotransferase subunit B
VTAAADGRTVEPAIGLEIHVQLATGRKLFCADAVDPAAEPNSHVCPVCLGLPGALPVLDDSAVDHALRVAVALGSTIHSLSRFDRKSYFYPDLPKGYQITQHARPLATGGRFAFEDGAVAAHVDIRRIHIEEDAGRLRYDRFADAIAIDFNRAGVPLLEIVTEPALRSPAAARACLVQLRRLLRYLEASECDMENGTLRVDANVSLSESASARVEIKNLNSFAYVEQALQHEIERQLDAVRNGRAVLAETRSWDAGQRVTRPLRSKEEIEDYRYITEPDLPPLTVSAERVGRARASLPELPAARQRRIAAAYDLPPRDAAVLTAERALADFFEDLARRTGAPRAAATWVQVELLGWLNRHGLRIPDAPVTPAALAELIALIHEGTVSHTAARRVFEGMAETGASAATVLARIGLQQVSDADRIRTWAREVVADHPDIAARVRAGDANVLGFLMGQLMRKSGGAVDPGAGRRILLEQIDA